MRSTAVSYRKYLCSMMKILQGILNLSFSHTRTCCVVMVTAFPMSSSNQTTRCFFRTAAERQELRRASCWHIATGLPILSSCCMFKYILSLYWRQSYSFVCIFHSTYMYVVNVRFCFVSVLLIEIQALVCIRAMTERCYFCRCITASRWLSYSHHSTAETCWCRCLATNCPSF